MRITSILRSLTVGAAILLALVACVVPPGFGQDKPSDPKGAPPPDCCRMMQNHPGMPMGGIMMQNRQSMAMGGMMPGGPRMGMGPGGPVPDMIPAPAPGPMGVGSRPGAELFQVLRRPEIQKELGISEEQRKKLDDLAFNSEKAVIQGNAALQVQRLELARLEQSENADRAAIDKKIQEIAQTEASLMRARINARLDMRGVLSKEQREKIPALLSKRPQANPMGMPKANTQPVQPKPQGN